MNGSNRTTFPRAALLIVLAVGTATACGSARDTDSVRSGTELGSHVEPAVAATGEPLAAAVRAADWLESVVVDTPYGPVWPDDAERPETVTLGLGSGVAGKVHFYLALHEASGESRHLDWARRGGDYLLAVLAAEESGPQAPSPPASLYGGLPGVGFVLQQLYRATGDPRYREGALLCVERLHRLARRHGEGARWNDFHDILSGIAGTGLFLLYAARELDHPPSLELAAAAGRELMARARQERGGLTWTVAAEQEMVLPNFSHGAAGIGFFLASLHQQTGDPEPLAAALAAGEHLRSVAKTEGGIFLVPYGWPDIGWERAYDVGWAHGPAGTVRLFRRLWEITGDDAWRDLVAAGARGIRRSGLPGTPADPELGSEPFPIDRRFGTAGVAEFFLARHRLTGDIADLDFARRLVAEVRAQATEDAGGLSWPFPRYGFMPDAGEPAAFTGYFYGAAGFGLLLLQLDAVERNRPWPAPLPDDPFGAACRRAESSP